MKNYTFLCSLVTLSLMFAVGGCSSVTPAGLRAASKLDPLNTPAGEISVAIGVPKALRLRDGDATLRMAFTGGSAASTVSLEKIARLQIRPAGHADPQPGSNEERVFVARISPEDASAIEDIQSEIRDLRAQGFHGEGSLSIEVTGGCLVDTAPDKITVSTWLRTKPSDGYVRLTRNADIARSVGARNAERLREHLRPCPETAR